MKDANRDVLDGGSLPALLADRARRATDRRLAIDAGAGLTMAAATAAFRPPLWLPITALAACLGLFGIWGILDREGHEAPAGSRRARWLAGIKVVVTILATVAAVAFGLTLLASAIGPIIS